MIVLQLLLWIIFFLIIPFLAGYALCSVLSIEKKSIPACFMFGSYGIWAVFQIVTVPLVVLHCSFTVEIIVISSLMLITCGYGLLCFCRREKPQIQETRKKTISDKLAFFLMIIVYVGMALCVGLLQHTDADDSRFVVNAVDIVRTNRMLLTNPATGAKFTIFAGDLRKDAVAPWAVYTAYGAKLTCTNATIFAHTVLPQYLMLILFATYWQLGELYCEDSLCMKCSFVLFAFLVNIFGCYTGYSAEAFSLLRIWQGKALVASGGIPALFLFCSYIYKNHEKWRNYILLYCGCFAMCLMSNMGIVIAALMCGCIGIIYGIAKRKVSTTLKIWVGDIICFSYYMISYIIMLSIDDPFMRL